MNKPTIIVLNGPAGVGKDTIADSIIDAIGGDTARHYKFKDKLIGLVINFYGLSYKGFEYISRPENKNRIIEPFDLSYREMMIHVAENVIKPVLGEGIFAAATLQSIYDDLEDTLTYNPIYVISDLGFYEELSQAYHFAKSHSFKLALVAINGEGSGVRDSRSYNLSFNAVMDGIPVLSVDYSKDEKSLYYTTHRIINWMNTL